MKFMKSKATKMSKKQELTNRLTEIESLKPILGAEYNKLVYNWYIEMAKLSLLENPDLDTSGLFKTINEPNYMKGTGDQEDVLNKIRNTLITYDKSEKYHGVLTLERLIELHKDSLAYLYEEREKEPRGGVLSEEFLAKFEGISNKIDMESFLSNVIEGYAELDTITKATRTLAFILSTKMFKNYNEEAAYIAMNFILIRGGYFAVPIHFQHDLKYADEISTLGIKKPNETNVEIVLDYLNYYALVLQARLSGAKSDLLKKDSPHNTQESHKSNSPVPNTYDGGLVIDMILNWFK